MKRKIKQKTQLTLVDEKDREIGSEEKFLAHKKDLKHRSFSIFIFNSVGQLLLQKRNKTKYHSGGLWSNTCCSHPKPGEKTKESAQKRLKEEMGFSSNLKEIFAFNYQIKWGRLAENEYDHVFIGRYEGKPKPDPDEVEDWKWMDLSKLRENIKKNPHQYAYWFKVIIEEHLFRLYNNLQTPNPYSQLTKRHDFILKKKVNAVNFFLPSAGCTKAKNFGPCTMCVFHQPWKILETSDKRPTKKRIIEIYKKYIRPAIDLSQAEVLCFLIGGSILDDREFPFEALCLILEKYLPSSIKKIEMESRPEYISDEVLDKLKKSLADRAKLTIYLGVETASQKYRNDLLKKRITNKEIIATLKKLKKHKVKSGAYLLAGLPYLSKKKSIAEVTKSVKWCTKIGFDEINICPTVLPKGNSTLKKLFKSRRFKPLNLGEIIAIINQIREYPVTVASLENDPPAMAGLEGTGEEKKIIENFNIRGRTDPVALDRLAQITPQLFSDKRKTRIFSLGFYSILKKVLHTLFGDVQECTEFYGIPRKKFEEEVVPFLTEIQVLVYLADIVIEGLEDSRQARNCLRRFFEVIDNRIKAQGIKDKKIKPLCRKVYLFLLKDREVRDKKLALGQKEILDVLHYKVSDLVALMKMAVELGGKEAPEKEWHIWRQFELIREFIDDWEDRDEDIKEESEQFNSIVQLERQGLNLKEVIGQECQKLQRMIEGISDKNKKKRFQKMQRYLVKKRIPSNFSFHL